MKNIKSIFLNLIFEHQFISHLLKILNYTVSSSKLENLQNIEKLEKKIIFLEEKIKTCNEEIQVLKENQKKILKMVQFLFILSLNLLGITLLTFIFLLKFHSK